MSRPTFESLKLRPHVGKEPIIFKEAQDMPPGAPPGGMPPDVGQSPVTGNPDEMQAPESANQRQFEDDFGQLAYQFVNDRAPALVPYMLGFEVVDRNEDGSKAVGIFGYKVDQDYYYIPAFFLNNQVRGVDMILNKKTNQFVPLTEKWIDYVIDKHSIQIGTPADNEVRDTMRNPDLTFVRRPRTALGPFGKTAEEAPWTMKEAWEHIKEATAKAAGDPKFKEMFAGICGQVEKSAEATYIKDFMEKVGGPECMLSFLKSMRDVEFADAALTLYKDAEAFWTEKTANAKIHVERMKKVAAARPKVRVVGSTEGLVKASQDTPPSDVGEEDKPLTVEENARQIVEHDFTIDDSRPAEEAATVTDDKALVDFEHRFNPPDGVGRYNFMMSDGVAREGVLLNSVVSPSCGKDMTFVLFEDDGNVLAEACPRSVMTTEFEEGSVKDEKGDDLKKLYDKAVSLSSVEVGNEERDGNPYLFIDDKGNAAGPFGIKFVISDGDHIRFGTGYCSDCRVVTPNSSGLNESYGFMDWNLRDRFHDEDGRPAHNGYDKCCDAPCCEECSDSDFVTVGTFSGMPKKTSAGVIIPKDWKALKLKVVKRWAPYVENEKPHERNVREAKYAKEDAEFMSKYTFASAMDILQEMRSEGIERIKVASDGVNYHVAVDGAKRRHGPMGYKEAAVDLVTRFGMRPRRAFSVLSKAASEGSTMLLVKIPSLVQHEKTAQDNLVGVSMPAPLEQIPAVDPYSGIPVYQSPYIDMTQGQFTGVPGLPPEGGYTKGINIGGEMERTMGAGEYPDEHDSMGEGALPIDEEARRLAEDAAKAGQRHVFDQAAIGGLTKVYDTANVVDSYIPDFMDTIDRLGRILFLFYWKHEDFNQRYGSDDVVQMEDALRNVFKQLGELTLHLKEKSVKKD